MKYRFQYPIFHGGRQGVFHELDGLGLDEIAAVHSGTDWLDERWLRGGFPRSLLANKLSGNRDWREAFVRTYLERDLPQLGINLPAITLRRFWTMLAHYHGQTWNGRELGRALGLGDKTVSRYLDILEGTYMAFRLQPWHTNLGKRGELFFWSVHTGAELDLLVTIDGQRFGFEIKLTRSPKVTPSMRSALDVLALHHLYVFCHGEGEPWPLEEGITAVPAICLAASAWKPLG